MILVKILKVNTFLFVFQINFLVHVRFQIQMPLVVEKCKLDK